jgi:mediator of RNA polymerase II transcription subunit 16
MATTSKQLRVVEVIIDWGIGRPEKNNPGGSLLLRPSLRERHVDVDSLLDDDAGTVSPALRRAELTHLEVLPSTVIAATQNPTWVPPLILSVRSHMPSPLSAFGPGQDHDQYQSIVDRWNVVTEKPQPLHSAFEGVGSRTSQGAMSLTPVTRLKKLEPIVLDKVVVGLHVMHFGRVVCLAFHDGTTQYRDRFTMEELYNASSPDRVSVLSQVGFQQSEETPCK